MLFAPTDPTPPRPPAPPVASIATRITPPNVGGVCSRHQTFTDGCRRCDEIIERRAAIRTERVRGDISRMMREVRTM